MNPELYLVALPALCGALFALGGTQISDKQKGWKGWRRFILPFAVILPLCWIATTWWQGLLVSLIACFVLHLGYGDKASWFKRALIFTGYGLISIPIGVSWWNLITFLGCLFLFAATRIFASNTVVHKVFELMCGVLIGIQISFLLAGNGVIW